MPSLDVEDLSEIGMIIFWKPGVGLELSLCTKTTTIVVVNIYWEITMYYLGTSIIIIICFGSHTELNQTKDEKFAKVT